MKINEWFSKLFDWHKPDAQPDVGQDRRGNSDPIVASTVHPNDSTHALDFWEVPSPRYWISHDAVNAPSKIQVSNTVDTSSSYATRPCNVYPIDVLSAQRYLEYCNVEELQFGNFNRLLVLKTDK